MNTTQLKSLKQALILFSLIFSMATIGIRAQSQPHPIVGNWIFDEVSSMAQMNLEVKQHLDSLPQLRTQVLSNYIGRTMHFIEDGSYQQLMTNGNSLTGTWSILAPDVLLITDGSGNVLQQQIVTLSPSTLILKHPVLGDTRPLFNQVHFTKN